MKILVTGGAGYIGTHALIELITAGHKPIVIDNLSNSSRESLHRVEAITGSVIPFYDFDLRTRGKLDAVFLSHKIDSVIHFAGLKAVGESVAKPLEYYSNNIDSTLILLDSMRKYSVKKLIFSSSAAVYGVPQALPLRETSQTGSGITNPYGWTKFLIEQILHDTSIADPTMEIITLRYFNPIGAHESGFIGEDPAGIPNNLAPYVAQVATGKRNKVYVYGNDYDTPDGTCLRDYIHVVDLAKGHLAALEHLKRGIKVYNLGTGRGVSVLEFTGAFSRAAGREIPYQVVPRRVGDIAAYYADVTKANNELRWHATKTLDDACNDSWRWQSRNPNGYTS